jgi:tRNA1Val (adenine37-N6)-methyltransferase
VKERSNFRFKQFDIQQNHAAMKVGTDGVLLGAWAHAIKPTSILDIGTGTGLIALMLAQRYPKANVTGVEMDKKACVDAQANFDRATFSKRLKLIHDKIQHVDVGLGYDLIVSNPPFFQNGLQTPDDRRTNARHTTELTYFDLIKSVNRLLSKNGEFALIIPFDQNTIVIEMAKSFELYPSRHTCTKGNSDAPTKRSLLQFAREETETTQDTLTIEYGRHVYSDAYKKLTSEFYLNM